MNRCNRATGDDWNHWDYIPTTRVSSGKAMIPMSNFDESVQEKASEKAEETFVNLDLDGNGEITEDEFIRGCFSDEYFITTMERARI